MGNRFLLGLATCLALAESSAAFAQVQPVTAVNLWAESPVPRSGSTSVEVAVRLGRAGRIWYALYSDSAAGVSRAELRRDPAPGDAALRRGQLVVASGDLGTPVSIRIEALRPETTYRLLMTGEANDSGPAPPDQGRVLSFRVTLAPRIRSGSFQSRTVRGSVGYYVYIPERYALHPEHPAPLLIFLHGIGERGDGGAQLTKLSKHGPFRPIADGRELPMVMIAPQLPASLRQWPVELVDEVIAAARAGFPIDDARIYLTGLSTGADAGWAYAMRHPEKVAALVSIAGNGDPTRVCAMREIAVWAFHGERDTDEKLEHEQRLVEALNACTPPPRWPARLTVYPRAGHNVWTETYDGTGGYDIYSWLLEIRKPLS